MCYKKKKRKRHGTDPHLPVQFCRRKTHWVPQARGPWLPFVPSNTTVSKSMLSSHNISRVSLQRKRENAASTALKGDSRRSSGPRKVTVCTVRSQPGLHLAREAAISPLALANRPLLCALDPLCLSSGTLIQLFQLNMLLFALSYLLTRYNDFLR